MNRVSPRRKRRYQSGYQGAMPSDCQGHTSTVAGDGGHQECTDFDKDALPEPRPAKQPKVSGTLEPPKKPATNIVNNLEKCHRFSVLVTDSDYFRKSESEPDLFTFDPAGNAVRKIPSKPERMELRFYCKLKDLWIDKYTRIGPKRRRRHRKITTGDPRTDKVLTNLELQGYGMIELLSRGKFSSVVVSYSQIQKKNVVLKFSRIIARRTETRACDVMAESRSWDDVTCSPEMFLYDRLKHKNVVKMYEYYVINGQVILSLEFCENGNMKQLIEMLPGKLLTEPVAYRYFIQMLEAVIFLHGLYIVHRDLNAEHFLIDHLNNVKLCDFSMAEEYRAGDTFFSDRCGSVGYLAPEVIEVRPMYNPLLVDIWALGVVLFEMTTGRRPFEDVQHNVPYTDTERQNFLDEMGDNIHTLMTTKPARLTHDILELFKGIFQKNTRDRFTLNRILYSDWCQKKPTSKLRIGNYYMVQQPQKKSDSRRENALKKQYEI